MQSEINFIITAISYILTYFLCIRKQIEHTFISVYVTLKLIWEGIQ